MSYPKPLSEKSLNRLYMQAGLSTETCAFLHPLFAACANLYGTIAPSRCMVGLSGAKKRCAADSSTRPYCLFRNCPSRSAAYRVYEIEELYTEEPHNDLDRHIVSKELIGTGYGKMFSFYALMEGLGDHPYCVPANFLSYAARPHRQWKNHWRIYRKSGIHRSRMCAKTAQSVSQRKSWEEAGDVVPQFELSG